MLQEPGPVSSIEEEALHLRWQKSEGNSYLFLTVRCLILDAHALETFMSLMKSLPSLSSSVSFRGRAGTGRLLTWSEHLNIEAISLELLNT